MKRTGFTLVELIFAIVIIGVLAATAIPKFKSLKESATVNNTIKIIKDAESSLPAAAANQIDLEGNADVNLSEILNLTGNYIRYTPASGAGQYDINASATSDIVGTITFNATTRTITTRINCNNFKVGSTETVEYTKCIEKMGAVDTNNTLTF